VRQAAQASHTAQATTSAANVSDRCFVFIDSCFMIQSELSHFRRHCVGFLGIGLRFGAKAGNPGAKR
jgi:hypothetical protein